MIYCHFEGVNFFQEIKSWVVSSHLEYLTPNFEVEIRKIGCITFVSKISHVQGKIAKDLLIENRMIHRHFSCIIINSIYYRIMKRVIHSLLSTFHNALKMTNVV